MRRVSEDGDATVGGEGRACEDTMHVFPRGVDGPGTFGYDFPQFIIKDFIVSLWCFEKSYMCLFLVSKSIFFLQKGLGIP